MTNKKYIRGGRTSFKKKIIARKSYKKYQKTGSVDIDKIISKGADVLSNEMYKKSIHKITKPAFIRKSYRRRTINRKI